MDGQYQMVIVGIGAVAEKHAKGIENVLNAQLVAGSCGTRSKGERFAERFDCTWYDDNEAMLEAEDPDVAIICTPSGTHREVMRLAAERSVHVLCEKPLDVTASGIDEMIALSDEHGIRFGCVFQRRYKPVVREIHRAIETGRIGDPAIMSVANPRWRDDDYYGPDRWQGTAALDGGGALINQTIHGIDQIQWFAQASMPSLEKSVNPVQSVYAMTDKLAHANDLIEVEDTAVAVLRYRNGALGQVLAATSAYPGSDKEVRVAGRNGNIRLVGGRLMSWRFREEDDGDEEIRSKYSTSDGMTGGANDPTAIDHSLFTQIIKDFLQSIDANEPFLLNAQEARKAVEIVEAIYRSTEAGQPITIP